MVFEDVNLPESERMLRSYLRRTEKIHLHKIDSSSRIFKYKALNLKHEVGIPDFYYRKDDEFIFVESKLLSDGLRLPQIEWMMKHNNFNIRIIFINIKY